MAMLHSEVHIHTCNLIFCSHPRRGFTKTFLSQSKTTL
ncbi:unnamed protein product [Haemonchus placei]|uniref:Uncharacterized protein n=1 Tax=Haemonchus placei TaxID=6290 RepID=A0A0N4WTC9_HAEPC|nr:unnamed protein product [Haemonchus placei]